MPVPISPPCTRTHMFTRAHRAQTLQEVAAAMQYLHRNDVLHGDLTGGNVLLTASDKDTRGFTAKVGGRWVGSLGARGGGGGWGGHRGSWILDSLRCCPYHKNLLHCC